MENTEEKKSSSLDDLFQAVYGTRQRQTSEIRDFDDADMEDYADEIYED